MSKEKVKLPSNVAKSLDTFIFDNYTTQMIVEMVAGNANGFVVVTLREFAKSNYNTFLQALVNGYEVEESKEDQVRRTISEFCNGAIVSEWVIDQIREIYEGIKH